jgi:putative MATE family efflux protein
LEGGVSLATTKDMTEGKPLKLIVSFALPLGLGSLFQQLYNVADSAIVGRLIGLEAFAAVGAAGFLSWMVISIILGITQGYGVLFAQRFGAKDLEGLRKAIAMSIKIDILFGGLLTVISIVFTRKILLAIQTPEDIINDTLGYIYWLFGGILITLAYNTTAAVLRALGNSKTPFYAVIISSLINIVLDIFFVSVFHIGVVGVAASTVFAQLCSFLYCLWKLGSVIEIHLNKADFITDSKTVKELLRMGFPLAFRNAVISLGGLVIQYVINGYGTLFIAGTTAAKKYFGLMEIIVGSIDGAFATFVGQNYGKGNLGRIKEGMRCVLKIVLISSLIIAAILLVFGRLLIRLIVTGDAEQMKTMIAIGYNNFLSMALCLPSLYLLFIYRSALQGMGCTLIPLISGFMELLLRILSVLLLPLWVGEWGVYLSDGLGWVGASCLLLIAYYITMYKKISRTA